MHQYNKHPVKQLDKKECKIQLIEWKNIIVILLIIIEQFFWAFILKAYIIKMSRFRNANIYKLVSNKNGLAYVGSTCLTLPQRISHINVIINNI